jgi:hypothetical protein
MNPLYKKTLGIIGSLAVLIVAFLVFIFIFAGIALGSDAGPSNATFRIVVSWLNLIGTPILSLIAVTYILKRTWSKKFALWAVALTVFCIAIFFITYIYPRFFLGL